NLHSLISGTPPLNGQWLDPDRTPIAGIPNVDFNGIAPGLYTYYFFIDNADPCEDIEKPVTIEVKDCNCPPFTLITPADVCNNTGTLDLQTLETVVPTPGAWSVRDAGGQNVALTGSVLSLTDLPAGQYTLVYTVTNPQPGCP